MTFCYPLARIRPADGKPIGKRVHFTQPWEGDGRVVGLLDNPLMIQVLAQDFLVYDFEPDELHDVECAPIAGGSGAAEPSCRLCGCTEDHACPGGCAWVEPPDPAGSALCSACAAGVLDVVFDGPPSAESGRFVEVENVQGNSVGCDEFQWIDRGDGCWALRLPVFVGRRLYPLSLYKAAVDARSHLVSLRAYAVVSSKDEGHNDLIDDLSSAIKAADTDFGAAAFADDVRRRRLLLSALLASVESAARGMRRLGMKETPDILEHQARAVRDAFRRDDAFDIRQFPAGLPERAL